MDERSKISNTMSQTPLVSADLADIPVNPRKLSEEIDALIDAVHEQPIPLRDLIMVMKGRAYTLLLIIISMPFCLPIPLPGLSTFFGTIIALIGLRLSLRLQPKLPEKILNYELSPKILLRMLHSVKRVAKTLEVFLRPRLTWLVEWSILSHCIGTMICVSGILLLLPLPVPFSNVLPALAIFFLSAALLERDGLFVIVGTFAFIATLFFFGGIFIGGAAAIEAIREHFQHIPPGD